ncbi:MAG TPA: hypothetical protein VJ044_07070, partial [Candidatus Hodarchaeales archaeon]|nr:hypothetical protein [Candidatus Hodarchaeales archaeon]
GHTIRIFKVALRLFLSMNDCDKLNWVRIGKIIPPVRRHGSDRAPTFDELKKILDNCELRMKCVVLLLLSSGVRVGAFEWLRWRDVEPVKLGKFEFAKITVYHGENEEYYSFVTPECYKYLLDYKVLREQTGEKVGLDSPLIRDDWGSYKGARDPAKAVAVTPKTLRDQLGRLYRRVGLRTAKDGIRHEFQQVHGFRKFFKSVAERHVKSIYVELLLGHSMGVTDSYMKPTFEEMIHEYSKAIPALTILSREEITRDDIEHLKKEAALEAMRAVASGFGLDPMKVRIEKEKELGREVKGEEEMELIKNEMKKIREPQPDPQMTVKEKELETYLKDGWQFVSVLPSQKILIRK